MDHVLTKQVYGIGITELAGLLARRSLYCSKWANGPHSVAKSFENEDGNVWFERTGMSGLAAPSGCSLLTKTGMK